MIIVPDLDELWRLTRGDPRICVALLDGPADLGHPSLTAARLALVPTLVVTTDDRGWAGRHGTHVASLLFGRHDGPVRGVAPDCRGVLLPIFESGADGLRPCTQLDLARAFVHALAAGAHVINVSGGEFTPGGRSHPLMEGVIGECARSGVLVVAAAGNDGCECLHVPAALETELAVGATEANGEPLPFSNWGGPYQRQGIVAPGQDVEGAEPGGGTARLIGTSCPAALVSGVAALLLSLQLRHGLRPDPRRVREALLRSAMGCDAQPARECPVYWSVV